LKCRKTIKAKIIPKTATYKNCAARSLKVNSQQINDWIILTSPALDTHPDKQARTSQPELISAA
jgi:hypothetical protein